MTILINLTPNNEENYDTLTANETSNQILCNYDEERLIIDGHKWPKNTILITGDSDPK